MPVIKTNLTLNADDVIRIQQAIKNVGETSETAINDYLHNEAGEGIAKSITKFLPRSNVEKVHAKDSVWWDQENYNLAVGISNSVKKRNSFYYLYYVSTGTGTSKNKGPNAFMEKGLDQEYDNVVEGIMNSLTKNIEKELK